MKNIALIIILFLSGYIFSQENKIKKSEIIPKEIDFNKNVKKIILTKYNLNKKNEKIDTVKTITEIFFSKKSRIEFLKNYNNSLTDLWRIVELDKLERIKTISRKDDGKMTNIVNQYFSNETEFPDSTLINSNTNYKEKYINHFKKNHVIKQDHFVNDSLQDYRLFKYNKKNKLIEDLYVNPENNTDETLVSKGDYELTFYPEKLTLYEYKTIKDTIVITKIRPKYSIKEITKKITSNDFTNEITEKFEDEILKESNSLFTSKDSISNIHFRYNNNEISSYYKTFTNLNSIVTKWTSFPNENEKTFIINIEIEYDKLNNWIKKTYSKDNIVNSIIERQIEYYSE